MDLKQANKNLDTLVQEFESLEITLESDLNTEDEQIKTALSSQIPLEYKWYPIASESRRLRNTSNRICQDVYYKELDQCLNNSYRKRTISEAKDLAKSTPDYREWHKIYVEADDLYSDVKDILDIINSRRYVLNNVTNAFISSVQNNSI